MPISSAGPMIFALACSALALDERTGKRKEEKERLHSQQPERGPGRKLGDELRLGDAVFEVRREANGVRIAVEPGAAPRVSLKDEKSLSFEVDARRRVELRFDADGEGAWSYSNPWTWSYELGGATIRLVDGDGDGRYVDFDRDGYVVDGSRVACPLERELVLGTNVVSIESIEPDGSRLSASIQPIDGSPQQLACLQRLNRLRTSNGLPPVRLDPALSAGCTAHAEYLRRNAWSGDTDPHGQDPRSDGASAEGLRAAQQSVIIARAPEHAIENFWRTYYHRVGLMSPSLARIGVNASPGDITVLDVSTAFDRAPAERWSGTAPAFVPAPGAQGFPTAAIAELPTEPVPDLGRRGCPLMLVFPPQAGAVTDFRGALFQETKRKRIEISVLPADPGPYPMAQGIVPERPLETGTAYFALFAFTVNGTRVEREVRFVTE